MEEIQREKRNTVIIRKKSMEKNAFLKTWIVKVYSVISVISTLMVFVGIGLYLYGQFTNNNQSDNDLIMKQIKREIGYDDILSMKTVDIHGFGNDSILIGANGRFTNWEKCTNRFVIMDTVNNRVLQSMNDPLGLNSSYKATYNCTLSVVGSDGTYEKMLLPVPEYALDIVGDITKEIVVKYYWFGSTEMANGTAILAYSYEDEMYRLVGTYPDNDKPDTSQYDINGNIIVNSLQRVETCFKKTDMIDLYTLYEDGEIQFCLNNGLDSTHEYWVKTSYDDIYLVMVYMDWHEKEDTYINIYQAYYDEENENLLWSHEYSMFRDDLELNYTKDELTKVLADIMDSQVDIINSL